MGAAMAAWAAYVLHSEVSGQGVVGWVTDLAVQQFGTASSDLCLLAALVIGVIPIGLVFRGLARAFGVTLVPPRGTLPAGTPGQIRRRAVLGGIAILLAAAGLITIVLPRPDGSPAVPFDLDAADAAPPDAPRVAVIGTPQPDLAAGYRETSSGSSSTIYRYIPLTAKTWTRGAPVRFFLAEIEHDDGRRDGIAMIPAPGRRPHYEGHLRRNAMPTLARGAFERNGMRLAEPYWVISNDSMEAIGLVMLIGGLGLALGLGVIIAGMQAARRVAMGPPRRPPAPIPPGSSRGQPPSPGASRGQPPASGVSRGQHPQPPGTAARNQRPTPPPIPLAATRRRSTTPPPIPPAALRRRSA